MKFSLSVNGATKLFFALTLILALAGCQTSAFSTRQVKVLQEQGFEPTDEGWALGLPNRLLFASDMDELSEEGRNRVTDVTAALLDIGINWVRLDGHTDSTGTESYNLGLSRRRALSVADIMKRGGMPDEGIEIRALGSHYPVADDSTEAGRQENRRVAIVIVSMP